MRQYKFVCGFEGHVTPGRGKDGNCCRANRTLNGASQEKLNRIPAVFTQ